MLDGKESAIADLLPARRRNDAVHAQIFHHLPIVIVRVGDGINRELDTGICLAVLRRDRKTGKSASSEVIVATL
jgi:hypothetical protein